MLHSFYFRCSFADGDGGLKKGRPSQLTLSPSDGALKDKIILQPQQNEDEDRGHMSEVGAASSITSISGMTIAILL